MSPPSTERGLSLVELMVGMALGLVLTLGLVSILGSASRNFRVQDDFARLQESGTAALRYLGEDLRQAGFYGWAGSASSYQYANPALYGLPSSWSADCGSKDAATDRPWALDLATPLRVEAPGADLSGYSCLNSANILSTSPLVVLRGASGEAIPVAELANKPFKDLLMVQSSPLSSPNTVVFKGSAYASTMPAGAKRYGAAGAEAAVFPYSAHLYYVRPCNRGSSGVCDSTSDNGQPVPTLARQELTGTTWSEVPLVEGIERMSLLFGEDTNNDGLADRFSTTPGNWNRILSARVAVLVRSLHPVAGRDDSGRTYDLGGGVTYTCSGTACQYVRQVFSQTVQLRNCAQRLTAGAGQC